MRWIKLREWGEVQLAAGGLVWIDALATYRTRREVFGDETVAPWNSSKDTTGRRTMRQHGDDTRPGDGIAAEPMP